MQLHTNIDLAAVNEENPAMTLERKIKGLRVAQAAEILDLQLLARAISACARREGERKKVKLGEASVQAEAVKAKAAELAEREAGLAAKAEVQGERLKLLQ